MWIDLWTGLMFALRAIFFVRMRLNDEDTRRKRDYFNVNKVTIFGIVASALITISLKWLEWGATMAAFPLWPVLCWIMWAVC